MAAVRKDKIKALEALLVLEARHGDRKAFSRLVELRTQRLLAHATRLCGDREAARDIAQEAWVQIFQGLSRLRDENAFLPWALCIVSRRVAAHIKTLQKDRAIVETARTETSVVTPAPEPGHLDSEAVRLALNQLPPAQQATVALFYLEDMSVAEVALALDVPVGTVKSRLMNARTSLRNHLKGEPHG
ncbi:RNA polymerase sigma factor [Labrenzia sp. CE80]|uniref:RNA polymerase sigma factor n=1 Tax=Labrenzia sp. CE80 TaxID=1788986 RepID=UPI00129B589B|nr:RNA polymerase sigma factor [Labrenzia sp. CE80]